LEPLKGTPGDPPPQEKDGGWRSVPGFDKWPHRARDWAELLQPPSFIHRAIAPQVASSGMMHAAARRALSRVSLPHCDKSKLTLRDSVVLLGSRQTLLLRTSSFEVGPRFDTVVAEMHPWVMWASMLIGA
jgi:hypothetical protein